MATQLNYGSSILLPPTITGPIFEKAVEASAVQQLARKVPLSVTAQTAIPIPMDVPTAGWVSEGGSKTVAAEGVGVKTMTGKKVALIVPVSEEVAMSNAAGLYSQLQQDLPTAIGRAFDYAAIHGKDLASGGAGPFGDWLTQTSNASIALGTAEADAGGMSTDLWNGVEEVVDANWDFTGFAADPRLRPSLGKSVDANGRPFFVNNALNANSGVNSATLLDYPVFFNRGVSGAYRRQGNLKQDVTINGSPTGGTWALTMGGTTATGLAYNISASTLQTALRALAPAGIWSTVSVSGTAPYKLTFTQAAGPVTADGSGLTGGTSPSVTVAQDAPLDSGVRAIGGDWSQCAWGQGMDLTVRLSREANYTTDGGTTWHSAFQENLVLLLVEAYFGFVVGHTDAFVVFTD